MPNTTRLSTQSSFSTRGTFQLALSKRKNPFQDKWIWMVTRAWFNYDTCFSSDAAALWAGDLQGLHPRCHPEEKPQESIVRVPGGDQLMPLCSLPQQRSGRFERWPRGYYSLCLRPKFTLWRSTQAPPLVWVVWKCPYCCERICILHMWKANSGNCPIFRTFSGVNVWKQL